MSVTKNENGDPVLDHDFDYEDVGKSTPISASEIKGPDRWALLDDPDWQKKVPPPPRPIHQSGFYSPGKFYPPGTYPTRRK